LGGCPILLFYGGKNTLKRNADILFATKSGRKETKWLILATEYRFL
jgi:hypothetical protein